jgi:hypothetical protein
MQPLTRSQHFAQVVARRKKNPFDHASHGECDIFVIIVVPIMQGDTCAMAPARNGVELTSARSSGVCQDLRLADMRAVPARKFDRLHTQPFTGSPALPRRRDCPVLFASNVKAQEARSLVGTVLLSLV